MTMSSLTKEELWVLSYYRASELAGALLFGRLARRTKDDEMRVHLTEHFAEEARHAWQWTKTIHELGHFPLMITETYQSAYAKEIGLPTSMPEILLLTKIFEERIFGHFTKHLANTTAHPIVKVTLARMLKEEEGHLGWIDKKLIDYDKVGMIELAKKTDEYRTIDEHIYAEVMQYEKNLWDFFEKK